MAAGRRGWTSRAWRLPPLANDDELLAVHEVLDKLAAEAPQKAELVKLRYFVGMTFEEAAETLGISVATAKRHWAYARAWLYEEIQANKRQVGAGREWPGKPLGAGKVLRFGCDFPTPDFVC